MRLTQNPSTTTTIADIKVMAPAVGYRLFDSELPSRVFLLTNVDYHLFGVRDVRLNYIFDNEHRLGNDLRARKRYRGAKQRSRCGS